MSKAKAGRSLTDYVMDKKRAACKVCGLPAELREQLVAARSKHIPRRDQIAWLAEEHDITIAVADFDAHHSGRHEAA